MKLPRLRMRGGKVEDAKGATVNTVWKLKTDSAFLGLEGAGLADGSCCTPELLRQDSSDAAACNSLRDIDCSGGAALTVPAVAGNTLGSRTGAAELSDVWRDAHAAELRAAIRQPLLHHPHLRYIRDINRGSSGFVVQALDLRTNREVAVKFIHRGPGSVFDAQHITRELLNHRLAGRHPNIVQLLEVFPTAHHLAIVMEFASGGDLSELIDQRAQRNLDGMPEGDAAWFMQQLVCAVDFCHRLGIANRDVKLDNMLLHGAGPRPMLRICDFGYSKDELGQSISKSTCGTPEYMSPEVLFEDRYDGKTADVWAMGVSMYVLLTGTFPFARESDAEVSNVIRIQRMFARIIKGDMQPAPHLSAECQDLLRRMLHPAPEKRASVAEVALHPWLARARPCLPPLRVNDQLISCMNKFGRPAGAGCRQGAAEIVRLVAACAEEHKQQQHVYAGGSRRDMRSQSASSAFRRQDARQLAADAAIAGRACSSGPEHFAGSQWGDPSAQLDDMVL